MAGEKHNLEQIVTLLRQIKTGIANGKSVAQACKESQITAWTYYRWRRICLFKGTRTPDQFRPLQPSYKVLQQTLKTTKRANSALTRQLKRQEFHFKVSSHIIAPRLIGVLEENRKLRIRERQLFIFMLRFVLGYVSHDEIKRHLQDKLPAEELAKLYAHMTNKSRLKRDRALIIIFYLYGVPEDSIANGLGLYRKTVKKYIRTYRHSGVDGVFPRQERVVKWSDPTYREALFRILHSPPKDHGFNRTTWRIKDLANVMARNEMAIGKDRVSAFIRDAGYRYMKARIVLTSNDPNYREKLDHIHQVLSNLQRSERFFSIDEFGPFAVKQQGGRRLVGPGEYPTVPQFQKSKGCLIVTAALELSKNQVTHFYSSGKNTIEMIKLLEILLRQHHDCTRLYFSWDAAGWHASKGFMRKVEEINSPTYRRDHRTPIVEIVPLPARAQFLNVIESIFSGLAITATPKDEIDRNTYTLFELETGVPTDAYGLEEAVKDHFLVPPRPVSVPLKFQREGITYNDLSEEEKEEWDALEWNEEGEIPERVEAAAVNKWLFNKDTVDKVLEHLMTRGGKVANGDRIGKTIVFAKNHDHAVFIAERFDKNYPQYKGAFARVIDFQVEYAQSLIDDLSNPTKPPHIAISVDMLDTGIDIPEVLNLVFFKLVRSKTKFWQMVGRGTRLSPNLFGIGKDKECFYIFDYCQNLEFFGQNPNTTDGATGESLGKRLFKTRVELISALDEGAKEETLAELRLETAELLRSQVAAMNVNNFIVRPKRKYVELYSEPKAWEKLGLEQQIEVADHLAGLPSELADEDQDAKQFDLLMLRLQLAILRHEPSYERLRKQVIEIAGLLEEKSSIPMVQQQIELIQEIQSDEFWQDVTTPILENVRKRLRTLVKLIEKGKRITVYTDFEDTLGEESTIELPGFGTGADFEKFRAKARQFLKANENHATIQKLRFNERLTRTDIQELEKMLLDAGTGTTDDLSRAKQEGYRLGLFLRSLIGLDREAAKRSFDGFLLGKTPTANQIEFINLMIDHLTQRGWMDPSALYESPFTDISARGVDGVFASREVEQLIAVLASVRQQAEM